MRMCILLAYSAGKGDAVFIALVHVRVCDGLAGVIGLYTPVTLGLHGFAVTIAGKGEQGENG